MDGIRFLVDGRVQGVGFRAWTRQTANRLGLVGSVRNLPDASVEIEVAGPEESLETFRESLRRGPPAARVTSISETRIHLQGVDDFSIRR